jgi:phage terminase small subunit
VDAKADGAVPDTALSSEVQQLRLAIERSTLLGARMQVTLQRIQLQEQRAARISQELEPARREVGDAQSSSAGMAAHLKQNEEQLSVVTDSSRRQQLEEVVKRQRVELNLLTSREQQARARETESAVQLR